MKAPPPDPASCSAEDSGAVILSEAKDDSPPPRALTSTPALSYLTIRCHHPFAFSQPPSCSPARSPPLLSPRRLPTFRSTIPGCRCSSISSPRSEERRVGKRVAL